MIVTLTGHLVLIDGALNSLGWAMDLVANYTLIKPGAHGRLGQHVRRGLLLALQRAVRRRRGRPGEKTYVGGLILTGFSTRCAAAIGFLHMKRCGQQWMIITCWMGVVIWCAHVFNMTIRRHPLRQ